MQSRRHFIATALAGTGAISVLALRADAAAHGPDSFPTQSGEIVVHPVEHASIVLETPAGVIYVDPVGGAELYESFPPADLILITHEHGDHYDAATLAALMGEETALVTNPAVHDMLSEDLAARSTALANGEEGQVGDMEIRAIPAYNTTEERKNFHPEGRDNGYVLSIDGRRVYVAGDTEGTDEMKALTDIDIAFIPMNLPFTMDAEQAAVAVGAFAPKVVYPYHYRGRDGGTQDPEAFAKLLAMSNGQIEVKFGSWYE
ncbi:MBL fold metallo-hydrolase [Profundibacterium mesophilum]|uniref:Metal-dependent hydrolase n=1 Tax=Profundibacterium mesophilum KAUST100406-0324 TaxID=1037889 RepID=A0A921NPH0_9RHOB|nr:MBL fold metallo-hydrolase [Profundibacterium mesophilum]KAF0675412.1 putative metal-dependent hydrolase [Profundibacterium mesophilum KAUST100406-0324]